MNLLVDIGNSSIKFAVAEGQHILKEFSTRENELQLLEEILRSYPKIKKSIISAVGKKLEDEISLELQKNNIPVRSFDATTPLPIKNNYASKATLGKDRLAAAIGAWSLYPNENSLVIDCGTAITYELITAGGIYEGGNIAPGMHMRFRALHTFTHRLPEVQPAEKFASFGKTTEEAIRAGVINGIIFEMEGYIRILTRKFPDLKVILTGGDAIFFVKQLKKTIFVVSNLVLVGLNRILEYND